MSKVILVNCAPTKMDKPELPHSIEPVATFLDSKGVKVEIVDNRVDDFRKMNLGDATMVGISSWSGKQILNGLETAEFIREKDPDLPIVWGGIHASLLPEQTIKDKRVDIVVRGEGELTTLELVEALEKGSDLKNVKGLTLKEKGKITSTPEREFMNLDELPFINFDLFDLSKYNLKEIFAFFTSRGCPHACAFCFNQTFHRNCWRPKKTEKVLEELEIIRDRFKPKMVGFADDNFFVNWKRIDALSKGIIERKIDIKWEADCRIDYFIRFEKEFIETFLKSGCKRLWLGGESGSPRTQQIIGKGYGPDAILRFAEKSKPYDFTPCICFVIGFPHEEFSDIRQTVDLLEYILEINPKIKVNNLWMFTPFPGTTAFEQAVKAGYSPPKTLEGWGNFVFDTEWSETGWLDKKTSKLANALTLLSMFDFDRENPDPHWRKGWRKWAYLFGQKSARFRWKHKFFSFPVELELARRYQMTRGMV